MTLSEIIELFPNQISSKINWVGKLSKLSLSDAMAKKDTYI
jgi:hypothetical protein